MHQTQPINTWDHNLFIRKGGEGGKFSTGHQSSSGHNKKTRGGGLYEAKTSTGKGLKRGGTKQNVNYSTKTEEIGCKWNMNGIVINI